MNRSFLIVLTCMSLLVTTTIVVADDYVDDVYYSEETIMEEILNSGKITPYYNKKQMKEVIFIEDTISSPQDTVRAIIRDKH